MHRSGRTTACFLALALVVGVGLSRAGGPDAGEPVPSGRLPIPAGLPRYEIDANLDLAAKSIAATERVRFTNRSAADVSELVFHVYPRYKVKAGDRAALSKTLEVLRLSPAEALDPVGGRMVVTAVTTPAGPAAFEFDPNDDTIMVVRLGRVVRPGESASVAIAFTIDLPAYWGRWGNHSGVTYLLNWYPILAHHDDKGWERTPFVPWHQPWHQEAGHYRVRMDLPEGQVVASTGRIVSKEPAGPGRQRVTILASPARDFAFVCSSRYRTVERKAGATTVRVHSFPEHMANAEAMLDYACAAIQTYERWFGPYFDEEFEIAPSFFGWNGNECSGLVLIDDRVFRLPKAGQRYLEHLVTHETCHQWFWNVVGTDGYAETFMDEGLVNCFTALILDERHGRNSPLIVWPSGLGWLPTIGREDLRLSGVLRLARRRGSNGAVIQDVKSMGQSRRPLQPGLRPRRQGRRDDPQPARPRPLLRLLLL